MSQRGEEKGTRGEGERRGRSREDREGDSSGNSTENRTTDSNGLILPYFT